MHNYYKHLTSIMLAGIWCLTPSPLLQAETNTFSQSAVERVKSYPNSFEDPSFNVSKIYGLDTVEDSISIEPIDSINIDFIEKEDFISHSCHSKEECKSCGEEKRHDCHNCCIEEVELCLVETSCKEESCCCCEEEVAVPLTGLAAVGYAGGGGGGGGFGGGYGGGGGGGGGKKKKCDSCNGDVPIPEPSTWLILGGAASLSAYLRKRRSS